MWPQIAAWAGLNIHWQKHFINKKKVMHVWMFVEETRIQWKGSKIWMKPTTLIKDIHAWDLEIIIPYYALALHIRTYCSSGRTHYRSLYTIFCSRMYPETRAERSAPLIDLETEITWNRWAAETRRSAQTIANKHARGIERPRSIRS